MRAEADSARPGRETANSRRATRGAPRTDPMRARPYTRVVLQTARVAPRSIDVHHLTASSDVLSEVALVVHMIHTARSEVGATLGEYLNLQLRKGAPKVMRRRSVLRHPFFGVHGSLRGSWQTSLRDLVADELWMPSRPVVPPAEIKRPQGGVQARAGDRETLTAIIFRPNRAAPGDRSRRSSGPPGPPSTDDLLSGAGNECGPGSTASSGQARRSRWPGLSVCDRLGQHVCDKRGPLTEPNPTNRGNSGSKIHLIEISAANTPDSLGLMPLVRSIPPDRSRPGPRRRGPAKLHADKKYHYDHLRNGYVSAATA